MQAATKALSANPEHKKGMREVFRAVNKIVAQIGGTQQQVSIKTRISSPSQSRCFGFQNCIMQSSSIHAD